jgi:hypothetical protein
VEESHFPYYEKWDSLSSCQKLKNYEFGANEGRRGDKEPIDRGIETVAEAP